MSTPEFRPTFAIIGASRCGTTSMARWLDAHPQVFVTNPKELFFFSHDSNYSRGIDSYLKHYEGAPEGLLAYGEATTDYANTARFPRVAARIARSSPDCRIIFMVRHPLRRIESHWQQSRSLGQSTLSLSEAVFENEVLLEMSHYLKTMEAYLEHFSLEQIHIVVYEDFELNAREAALGCVRHIGLDESDLPALVARAPDSSRSTTHLPVWMRKLGQTTTGSMYRKLVPEYRRAKVRQLMERRKVWNTAWDNRSIKHVKNILQDDSERFLEQYCAKDRLFWRFQVSVAETATTTGSSG